MMRRINCFAQLALFFAGVFLVGCQAPPREISSAPQVLAEFSFPRDAKLILLPVTFQGQEHTFCLDTGCTDVVFDVSLKDKLGKRVLWPKKGQAAHGESIKVEYFPAPQAQLGPLSLKCSALVAVADLKQLSPHLAEKADGIIGMDFLKKYVVQIDFDQGKVLFLKARQDFDLFSFFRPQKNEHPEWGEPVPIQYKFFCDLPHIKGRVHDRIPVKFMVDTGWVSYHGALESKIFNTVSLKKCEERVRALAAAGEEPAFDVGKLTLVDKLTIASFEYDDIAFSKSNESILGWWFLSRHVVTFDFPHDTVYLKKGKRFDEPSDFHLSMNDLGFVLAREANHIIVLSVDPDGPAQAKGIRPDDVLLRIDGHDLGSYTLRELTEFICQMDKKEEHGVITFTVKRGNDIKQVSFGKSDMVSEKKWN
jgi:predicted aspartyl protease